MGSNQGSVLKLMCWQLSCGQLTLIPEWLGEEWLGEFSCPTMRSNFDKTVVHLQADAPYD